MWQSITQVEHGIPRYLEQVVTELTKGTVIAGKYRLERPLARGGMGSVWVARHVELDVDVALKVVIEERDPQERSRKRFRREAKAAAKLKSPHVTQIHDYGVHDGRPYIAMELLEGEDLDSLLRRRNKLSLARASEIVMPLCLGLKVAHEAGIVHRDLKPSNVYLAKVAGQEVVKLLDFGIAKDLSTQLSEDDRTASGTLLGSPRYMSPEQATGDPLDHRTDLWSVGVMLYEMVSGRQLFRGSNLGRVITDIVTKEIEPPSSIDADLGEHVDRFFEVALARQPDDRFITATDLASAFAAVARGEPMPPVHQTLDAPLDPAVAARGRSDPTAELAAPAPPKASPTEATRRSDEGTSPGVGLDTQQRAPRTRLWISAGVVVAGVLALAYLLRPNDARAPAPATGTATAAGAVLPSAGASGTSLPSAAPPTSSPSARASAEAPATAPVLGRKPPRALPSATGDVAPKRTRYDDEFGLEVSH